MVKQIQTAWIIDDDEIYKYGFRNFVTIKNLCTDIVDFCNGKEAIDYLIDYNNADNLPDIIFLDIHMAIMNGWEFVAAFGEIKQHLPKKIIIIMVTSSIDYEDIVKAKTFPDISNYIIKPTDFNQLASAFEIAH